MLRFSGKLLTSKRKVSVVLIAVHHIKMWKHKENKLVDGNMLTTYFEKEIMLYLGF
tara:strand:+ start:538 stop:705 length:168 start_codon:yes stop_codon:yes gene_type:complete